MKLSILSLAMILFGMTLSPVSRGVLIGLASCQTPEISTSCGESYVRPFSLESAHADILEIEGQAQFQVYQTRDVFQFVFNDPEFLTLCNTYSQDPGLVARLIHFESGFQSDITSSAGAVGPMQITPICHEDVVTRISKELDYTWDDMLNYRANIEVGLAYLQYLQQRFATPERTLYAYVAGPSRASKWTGRMADAPEYVRNYVGGIAK